MFRNCDISCKVDRIFYSMSEESSAHPQDASNQASPTAWTSEPVCNPQSVEKTADGSSSSDWLSTPVCRSQSILNSERDSNKKSSDDNG